MKTTLALSSLVLSLGACGGLPPEGDGVDVLSQGLNGPVTCAIETENGNYLTAVGGGGRTFDVIHTDATRIGAWEKFVLVDTGEGSPIRYGLQTANGHYLTAIGGGGRISDVIHSDATKIQDWEKFEMNALGFGVYGIQTHTGNYLTATGGGGHNSGETIHSDATTVRGWEQFRLICGI